MAPSQAAPSYPRRSKPRWWPAVVFVVLTAGAIVWVRFIWDVHQQDRNIWTFLLCAVGFLCLMLWLLVLSRVPWRTRWIALGTIALMHVLVLGLVRIKGVDGDLVPIIEWRWARGAGAVTESARLPASPGTIAPAGEAPDGWPQFLGPDRNGTVADIRLEPDWALHAPRELWRIPVNAGWSGFAVSRGLAVTQEQEGGREVVICLDALTGERLWRHDYNARYATTIAGEGPRSTPAIDVNRVYAVGATGWLTCLELRSGELIWTRNAVEEHGGRQLEWGFSVSPLIVGDLLILSVGGTEGQSLVAFNKLTGETVWAGGTDSASYSSPIACELEGQPQVVVFNMGSVVGHDLETGQVLWERAYDRAQVHVAVPLVLGEGRILVSSGYGHGSELYSVKRDETGMWSANLVWKSRRMKAKFTNLIEREGFIYGLDDGILACIAVHTGKLQWKDGRYGHGQGILVGEHLLMTTETGELVLIQPDPRELLQLSKMRVFSGKTWNPPALAGRYLFLRTDREAVCLELPLAE